MGRFSFAWMCAVLLFVAGRARAQDPVAEPVAEEAADGVDASEPPATDEVVDAASAAEAPQAGPQPPELLNFVEAPYPESELGRETPVAVELRFTVNVEGRVEGAEVSVSGGAAFDAAALEAVRQFTFKPAQVEGEARAARIGYRYLFEPPPAPEPVVGALEATIVDATGQPVPDLGVRLVPLAEGEALELATDAAGQVSFAALAPGSYRLSFATPDGAELAYEERVADGELTAARYALPPVETGDETEEFGAVATVKAPPREVTRRRLEARELNRIAGTRGDPLRAIEILPGVGRPPFLSGEILIRGASPDDSQVFLGGSPIPRLYHFGGFVSIFPSSFVGAVDFVPGNFSVRYGRKLGGIIEVTPSEQAPEDFGGFVDISLVDASLMLETPITEDLSISVSGRRSYVDVVFETLVPDDAFSTVAAPVYWDYQARIRWTPTVRDEIVFGSYGSQDSLRLLFQEAADQDPGFRGNLRFRTGFHRGEGRWKHRFSKTLKHELLVAAGADDITAGVGTAFNFELDTVPIVTRSEWSWTANERFTLNTGLDLQVTPFTVAYKGVPVQQQEGNPQSTPFSSQDTVDVTDSGVLTEPAVFAEAIYTPIDPLTLIGGLRADYFSNIERFSVDPRLAARYQLTDTWLLKSGAGLFTQPALPQEASRSVGGNPDLKPQRAVHLSAGFEKQLAPDIQVGVEGFYKHLFSRIVGTLNGAEPGFINDGVGRIYGAEFEAKWLPKSARFYSLLSYTLMRSERNDRDEGWRPFDFDQTHILNFAGGYRFKANVEIGGRFLLVSGNPTTPVTGSVYDAFNDLYIANFGPVNSARNPLFHRLDVRVAKYWERETVRVMLYLDIQNIYNNGNQEDIAYNFDYTEQSAVEGLPILPSIGLRVQF